MHTRRQAYNKLFFHFHYLDDHIDHWSCAKIETYRWCVSASKRWRYGRITERIYIAIIDEAITEQWPKLISTTMDSYAEVDKING